MADGLRTTVGTKTIEIIREYVKDIITVSEEEIVNAMHLIWGTDEAYSGAFFGSAAGSGITTT